MFKAYFKIYLRKLLAPIIEEEVERSILHIKQKMLKVYSCHGDASRLLISDKAVVNNALFNLASGNIEIEEFVFFGHGVSVLTGNHDISKTGSERMMAVPRQGRDIFIRRGAWLASNVTVIGPSEIGENAVIGACSLVIGDVPPNTFYAGVPARFIKNIQSEYRKNREA